MELMGPSSGPHIVCSTAQGRLGYKEALDLNANLTLTYLRIIAFKLPVPATV